MNESRENANENLPLSSLHHQGKNYLIFDCSSFYLFLIFCHQIKGLIFIKFYFTKSSIVIPKPLAIFMTVWMEGLVITFVSILVSVVYGRSAFLANSSCVNPCLLRSCLILSPMFCELFWLFIVPKYDSISMGAYLTLHRYANIYFVFLQLKMREALLH